ncbi:hypothetical protein SAMN02745221_01994 [Thermosyntropha lipolytica DSM 11003]|uniref:Uncharacterized protein n=1 Tax=Thermosyntropha lipolytica DSM 11003 TaxID=1123382 RepID=A0A1M5RBN2_9FIRM|nr:hypothetical protein [Thermosyntropha lipolytica]SHH23742.1 hypothetical protein SAMN02745221_01994 [Thermosyntropha lipolytica DSM 11003]
MANKKRDAVIRDFKDAVRENTALRSKVKVISLYYLLPRYSPVERKVISRFINDLSEFVSEITPTELNLLAEIMLSEDDEWLHEYMLTEEERRVRELIKRGYSYKVAAAILQGEELQRRKKRR